MIWDYRWEQAYTEILHRELIPATGCTEPVAIAYAFAVGKKYLESFPSELIVECSENLIKNARAVVVPQTGGLCGIEAAAIAGVVCGDADGGLDVLHRYRPHAIPLIRALLRLNRCRVERLKSPANQMHLIARLKNENHHVLVEICYEHTHIIRIERDGQVLYQESDISQCRSDTYLNRQYNLLNLQHIMAYSRSADIDDLERIIEQQIRFNLAISDEGLHGQYGAGIGRTLLSMSQTLSARLKGRTAAGSDARMSGCQLPVVINSGSGNQGMTVSLPVIEMAREIQADREHLKRALILSNLVAIYQKWLIGRLSAFCGVVSAAAGAAAGMTYLMNGTDNQIEDAVSNTLATAGGIFCDGAKPSCAAKIAVAVESAFLSHQMAMNGQRFDAGTGIVQRTADDTIAVVGYLGRCAMRETDRAILTAMLTPEQLICRNEAE